MSSKASLLLFFCVGHAFSQNTGSITGRVSLEEGNLPILGAEVVAVMEDAPKGMKPFSAVTLADGSYTLSGLPDGEYLLCPNVRSTDLVQPCEWGRFKSVIIANGQPVSEANMLIERGKVIEVRVHDPKGILEDFETKTPGVALRIAVAGRGFPKTAKLSQRAKNNRTYSVVVPFDVPAKLIVQGSKLSLSDTDQNNKPIQATDQPIEILEQKAAKGQNKVLHIRVDALLP